MGRGVLIDYASWADQTGTPYKAFESHCIPIQVADAIAQEAGITFQKGDILFLRTGYVKAYQALSADERKNVATVRAWIGLGQSRETIEWLWEKQFAAVASDSPGFECRRKSRTLT